MQRPLGLRFRRAASFWVSLCSVLAFFTLQAAITSRARAQEGSGPSGSFQDANKTLEWNISGASVGRHRFSPANRYWTAVDTKVTSRKVTFSGTLRAAVNPRSVTSGSLWASLRAGDRRAEVRWPDASKGESGNMGRGFPITEKQLPFSLTLEVNPGERVYAEASAAIIGGIAEYDKLYLDFEPLPVDAAPASSEEPAPLDESERDLTQWVLLGGGGAAALAAAAAAIARARARAKSGQDQAPAYILQLSTQAVRLAPGQRAPLGVAAWRVDPSGGYQSAGEATITLTPSDPALVISPASGTGTVQATLCLQGAPAAAQLTLAVTATASGAQIDASVQVEVGGGCSLEVLSTPDHKNQLRPDTGDGLFLWARVVDPGAPAGDPRLLDALKEIRFDRDPNDGWLDPSADDTRDGWRLIYITARNPQPHLVGTPQAPKPPAGEAVRISAVVNGQTLAATFPIALVTSSLELDLDRITFVSEQRESFQINAWVENAGGAPWQFDAAYGNPRGGPAERLSDVSVRPIDAGRAVIELPGPIVELKPREKNLDSTLIVKARQGQETPLERHVGVQLVQEGLFVERGLNEDGYCRIRADGSVDVSVEFGCYVRDPATGVLAVAKEALGDLEFLDIPEQEQKTLNVLEVLKLDFAFDDLVTNIPLGRYRITSSREIPGAGDVIPAAVLVRVRGRTDEAFQGVLKLGIETHGIGPQFPDWQAEYRKCLVTIDKHVPVGHREKLRALLEARKMTLGAEGLHELRRKIYRIAQNLILAEGASGYESAAYWDGGIAEVLEWTEWAGGMAFSAVAATFTGPFAPFYGITKTLCMNALRSYQEGKSLGQFIWESFNGLFRAAEGKLIDVDRLSKWVGDNRAVAWGLFVSYHFLYNLYQTKSVIEALKAALREVRDELIVNWLVAKVKAEGKARGYEEMPPVVSKLRKGITKNDQGQPIASKADVLEVMGDPQAVRSLKDAPPDVQQAFERRRQAIYAAHDQKLRQHVADKLGVHVSQVRVDDFRTPGATGSSINTDRDYRVLKQAGTDASGKPQWLEVDLREWREKSYEIFGEVTDKPANVDATTWADQKQQRGTSKVDIEASPSYSDQGIDPRTGKRIRVAPNIIKVEHGEGKLDDPEALGNMYHRKVTGQEQLDRVPEAYAQCKKTVTTLQKVREGYEKQGYEVGQLPENIRRGMDVVRGAKVDQRATPEVVAETNRKIREAGFQDLNDFSNKMAAQFSSLKWAKLKPWYRRWF